jgi:hypothetical protein
VSTITIQGIEFSLPGRYRAGHQINDAEAQVLNGALSDRLRSNFSPKVKEALAEGRSIAELRNDFAAYANQYQFQLQLDPAEALARRLALEAIQAKLRSQGKPMPSDEAWIATALESALTKPYFREEAQRRLASAREAASQVLDLDATLG